MKGSKGYLSLATIAAGFFLGLIPPSCYSQKPALFKALAIETKAGFGKSVSVEKILRNIF